MSASFFESLNSRCTVPCIPGKRGGVESVVFKVVRPELELLLDGLSKLVPAIGCCGVLVESNEEAGHGRGF